MHDCLVRVWKERENKKTKREKAERDKAAKGGMMQEVQRAGDEKRGGRVDAWEKTRADSEIFLPWILSFLFLHYIFANCR